MSRYVTIFAIFFFTISISITPSPSLGAAERDNSRLDQPSALTMTADLMLCRPLGLVSMVGGTAVFLVSSPFSALGGNIEEAWDSLVVTPADYTFVRPLGHFD